MRVKFFFLSVVTLVLGFAAIAQGRSAKVVDGELLSCAYLFDLEQAFLTQHVIPTPREKIVDGLKAQYVKKLDPAKLYLHQSDVKWIEAQIPVAMSQVRAKKCDLLMQIQKRFQTRVKERVDYAKALLGKKDFKFNEKTSLVLSPDKRKYAKNKKDADQFQAKYIQFQISNSLMTDQSLEEAKASVIRNYERVLKKTLEVKDEDIYASYLDAVAHARDPHSSFLSHSDKEDFKMGMTLSLEGIGATLSSQDGFTTIEQLVPGGGADQSGQLRPKDQILAVGDGDEGPMENVVEMELKDVVKKIRGPKGTKVRLSILRKKGGEKERFIVTITRDKVNLEDEAAKLHTMEKTLNGQKFKVGLIELPSFYADSTEGGKSAAKDMRRLLEEANQKKLDGLVLDLSRNGGGSLDDAVKIAGLFFKVGNVVKQSGKGLLGNPQSLRDKDPTVNWSKPLVILTSRISASASEIVAGALKDYKRAVIVGGDHTFGKGSIQSVMDLPLKLGAIKITVGMFFLPGGRSTQHIGVDSDIVLPSPFTTEEIGEKTLDFSLPPQTLSPFISAEAFTTTGKDAWSPVKPNEIKSLAELSAKRVANEPKFKEILEELQKAKKRDGVVKIEDMMKEKDTSKDKDDKKKNKEPDPNKSASELFAEQRAERTKDYLDREDIKEAINVLVDFLNLRNTEALAQAGLAS